MQTFIYRFGAGATSDYMWYLESLEEFLISFEATKAIKYDTCVYYLSGALSQQAIIYFKISSVAHNRCCPDIDRSFDGMRLEVVIVRAAALLAAVAVVGNVAVDFWPRPTANPPPRPAPEHPSPPHRPP